MNPTLTLKPRKITVVLGAITACLVVAHLAGIVLRYVFGHDYALGLFPLFDLDAEGNIPTYFSTFLLLISAGLLCVIAAARKRQRQRDAGYWIGLTAVFLFLSLDEFVQIHERLTAPVRTALNTSGWLVFAWVIPYGILLVIFCAVYLRFLLRLPVRPRRLIALAGVIYVSGAMGFELLGSRWLDLHGQPDLIYGLVVACEESMEMSGTVVFVHGLMLYIGSELGGLRLCLGSGPETDPAGAVPSDMSRR